MALSLSNFLYAIAPLLAVANAATVTFDWNATWVNANPDGMFNRRTMGINGQWPCPTVNITKGDNVIVNLYNGLGDQSTSLHFHGLFQNGTTEMDGVVGVSQCGIPPGASFTYNFTVDQPGTYWYHSHERGQYPDGLRGPITVHDPESPYLGQYAKEFVLSLSDWYHDQMTDLLPSFISLYNPTGAEPVPDSALMNDNQNGTFAVEPNTTYMFHIVNVGAFAGQYLWFEGHTMQIVEVDGVWTEAQEAEMIYITAAQRYSVLVTTKNQTSQNFAIVGSMDQDLFDTVPPTLNPNVTTWLQYNSSADLTPPTELDAFDDYDDFFLVPVDREPLWENPSQRIEMTMMMDNLGDGANYAFINGVSYVRPKVPSLYTALTSGNYSTDPVIYGPNTNAFVLGHNEVIEIILNNNDPGKHPFHLHGHTFQAIVRSEADAGWYTTPSNDTEAPVPIPAIPMRRDVLMVRPNGHYVIRFRSDNPGVWLFHCHIEWHVDSGLIATIIEAPLELQTQKGFAPNTFNNTDLSPSNNLNDLSIPSSHFETCALTNTPTSGNAAGNTENLMDLTGANTSPKPLPAGFEAKGIVALVFSALSAVLGMVVIGWYGSMPIVGAQGGEGEDGEKEGEKKVDEGEVDKAALKDL